MQVARIKALVNNGKASGSQLSQQKATLANSQLAVTQAENNLALSLLTLSQLLELPTADGFSIAKPDISGLSGIAGVSSDTPDAVYAEALGLKPEIVAAVDIDHIISEQIKSKYDYRIYFKAK